MVLGIIDAFELGDYLAVDDVLRAIQAPSPLSDWLLKKNYPIVGELSPFRYRVAEREPVILDNDVGTWFDDGLGSAVPLIFWDVLEKLEQRTGFSFRRRWEHEWRWLQATHGRPPAVYPSYFSTGDGIKRGHFDLAQREVYVSAYLRTLAYGALRGVITQAEAEHSSVLATTVNRGLAKVMPLARPEWTRGLIARRHESQEDLIDELWRAADDAIRSDEVPLAVRVIDWDESGFVQYDCMLVLGVPEAASDVVRWREVDNVVLSDYPGEMRGRVGGPAGGRGRANQEPVEAVAVVHPEFIGRTHLDMAFEVTLASPTVFGSAEVRCDAAEIRLEREGEVESRWVHWYADWEPAMFPERDSCVGWITTVRQSSLNAVQRGTGEGSARVARVQFGERERYQRECTVEYEEYLLR
ncbi:MAG: hypothetical protein F4012_08010 [Gemmatimonadales bacterium]|nr:hypothetical protein [Gemmatimonadales bacterium]